MAKKQKRNKKDEKIEKLSGADTETKVEGGDNFKAEAETETKDTVKTEVKPDAKEIAKAEAKTEAVESAKTATKENDKKKKTTAVKDMDEGKETAEKPKPKVNHFVFVTTDDKNVEVNRYQVRPWLLWLVIVVLCILIGSMLGYISHEEKIWRAVDARSDEQVATIKNLEESKAILEQEKLALETEIVGLNETVQILSETVSQKTQSEKELREQIEKQSLPTEFPLNGSATMDEKTIDDVPICVFDASIGSAVVATASGKVTAVKDDADYVHSIWVDHGNGYITIYRNAGEPRVQVGDSVVCGTALYIIEERKEEMGYQMMKDNQYINPMDLLSING